MSEIKKIKLGSQGLIVPAVGLGCMGMTDMLGGNMYGKAVESDSISTIHRSLELGGNFLDTADLYGPLINEQLVGKATRSNRQNYIIATKFGFEIDDHNQLTWQFNGSKAYVKKAVERSLKNLNTDYIDLYYLHRLDKNTPIEETVEAMAELVKEGKVKYIGLSEVSSATIRRAQAVYPLTAVQTEYSLFERSIEETDVKATLAELGIGLVAYSPLGRGFLSGQFKKTEDFPKNDFRRTSPKYMSDQLKKNVELLEEIEKMASEKGVTSTQLALAWTISKGAIPIPGTKRVKYVEQNISATYLELSTDDLIRLESIIPLGTPTGNRYDDAGMQAIDNA
ncbi:MULTISPECIES: aldo/keto reductase [Sphingobacterium]|uniref:aldo/keto reductase n=1 Tax=Sphingobacterium TaxID=28453 RepID=UPI0010455FF0|nr:MULTISPECIES: aldo/keto reductase [Sphingobacterium]MCW2263730.1 aryl-alcohol dehydrogenase-like predicted oxidoreductase [Sphingobacterium kitahiroshimense]TCR03794.1 aryl-alcohol dehydrogenase-like predicted oxidoreductase [Sphingobacterium sp. JUb78]